MKVLYDHQIFSWQTYGGISRYFYEIISRISKIEGIDVDLFQGFNINKYNFKENKDSYCRFMSFPKPDILKTSGIFNYINRCMIKRFSLNKKYDIYHPTYYNDYLIDSEKVVLTVYDMIHELFSDQFINDNTTEKKRKIISKADGIISISERTKSDLINLFDVKEEKIKVIYLANSLYEDVSGIPLIPYPYLLYVGNRGGYKNFDNLLKAFAKSNFKRDFKLVCFGGGNFKYNENMLIKKLGLSNNVIQEHGDDHMLANLYRYAKLFVYPSKYEGFGFPPLEAMYYGTPVLASKISSIPEVVGEAGIYFDPNSVEEIKEKIDIVLNDEKVRRNLIEKGRMREKLFSWDRCVKETLEFYKEVSMK